MSSPGFPPYLRNDSVPIDFNCTQGIQWVWVILRQCAVSPKEIAGVSLGLLSAVVWIVFLIPQIVENYRKGIPDKAISPTLLACFIIGDSFNLVGCLLTHQLPLQVYMVEISTADESNGGGVAQEQGIACGWKRGTTEGLSPIVFVLSVIGNLAYGLQIFLTSVERNFLIRSLPWVAGSFGVLIFDTTVRRFIYPFSYHKTASLP
ncbi:unnamed protein product [Mesocestoides corti]|uniref:Uncharacterized protein n=1 Tax=Mesocestoides corti TaxID=53468 RepID=A0A0R3UHA3_MESCO|nr:unnamed protein product [Mesocestoides corti]